MLILYRYESSVACLNNGSKTKFNGSLRKTGAALHFAQLLRDEGGDLVSLFAAVGEGLKEVEVGERETAQRRLMVVTGIEADGAVRDVNSVTTKAPA